MSTHDFHLLPKMRDSYGWLYVEHAIVDREDNAIVIVNEEGRTAAPCAGLAFLMIGPGVSITHAAVRVLAENGCLMGWTGERGVRLYASGVGETRSSRRLLHQARMWADETTRLLVVRNLYQARFPEPLPPGLSLRQIRGMEGMRVRRAYAEAAERTGLPWSGRSYRRDQWDHADPINRALSSANACLYGICHAAIVSAGYSPAIGFIHTGNLLAFVYDIADLYKAQLCIPTAFDIVAQSPLEVERRVRIALRDAFHSQRILQRIIPDIHRVLAIPEELAAESAFETAEAPLALWDPEQGSVAAGIDYSQPPDPSPPQEPNHGRHDSGTSPP